jgi:type VI secretion system secreted protein Hcp
MGIRGNMWIKDSQDNHVKGDSMIAGREDSIEVLSMNHKITSPVDMKTGKLTGNRTHSPVTILKKIDISTPFLTKACCSGECLKEIRISLYHVNKNGREVAYFRYTMTNARIAGTQPIIGGTEDNYAEDKEQLAIIYEKMHWQHIEGNYAYTDSWNERD